MASGSKTSSSIDYGLPPRPPTASTAIWTHLLRTTTTSEAPKSLKDVPIIAPPMAPLDKNATSMRVLLHDTQTNFEKFTVHVGKLLEGIQETKNELKTVQSFLERDRTTFTDDIVDLVNRSQREIQKSIGTPVQANVIDNLVKEINHRLDGLDQRLDAITAFNQTHSQALQTQMQTVQLILDKQGSILSAVAPVLPLLQSLPPLIDAAKTVIAEKLGELSTSQKVLPRIDSTTLSGNPARKRKRSFAEQGSSFATMSPLHGSKSPKKKSRIIDEPKDIPSGCSVSRIPDTQPTAYVPSVASSSSPSGVMTSSANRANSRPKERRETPTRPGRTVGNFAVPTLPPHAAGSRRTPSRVDLATAGLDSSIPPPAPLAAALTGMTSRFTAGRAQTNVSSKRDFPLPQAPPTPNFFGITPTAARPPRMLRVHASLAAASRAGSVVSPSDGQKVPVRMTNMTEDPDLDVNKTSALPKATKNAQGNNKQDPVHTSTAQTQLEANTSRHITRLTRSATRSSSQHLEIKKAETSISGIQNKDVMASLPGIKQKGKIVQQPAAPGKTKEWHSHIKDGRRFISLIDSDDEDQ